MSSPAIFLGEKTAISNNYYVQHGTEMISSGLNIHPVSYFTTECKEFHMKL